MYVYPSTRSLTPGLTLRQHYAGLAMQGMLSRPDCQPYSASVQAEAQHLQTVAAKAVQHADALLAELAKYGKAND